MVHVPHGSEATKGSPPGVDTAAWDTTSPNSKAVNSDWGEPLRIEDFQKMISYVYS